MATRFEVRQGLSQADAFCLVTKLEARGHKQSYGSEPRSSYPTTTVSRSVVSGSGTMDECLCSCASLRGRSGGRLRHRYVH